MPHVEVLGFFGKDKSAAWAEAFRLGELLVRRGGGLRASG